MFKTSVALQEKLTKVEGINDEVSKAKSGLESELTAVKSQLNEKKEKLMNSTKVTERLELSKEVADLEFKEGFYSDRINSVGDKYQSELSRSKEEAIDLIIKETEAQKKEKIDALVAQANELVEQYKATLSQIYSVNLEAEDTLRAHADIVGNFFEERGGGFVYKNNYFHTRYTPIINGIGEVEQRVLLNGK
ncbi:hypothetical protein [Evansella clarkii]|uniref:hypothetical protein n=1 Tax=Evansella clarkii TaxID=79879 RepID=UPI000B454837|nr:hypothetical protein [Evansella clarkii]